jgi:hypothetical protein
MIQHMDKVLQLHQLDIKVGIINTLLIQLIIPTVKLIINSQLAHNNQQINKEDKILNNKLIPLECRNIIHIII